MKENYTAAVKQVLSDYLEENGLRKTPERFAVLETAYSFGSHFSIKELSEKMESQNFPVSRATLYSALNLFVELRLIACHRLGTGSRYEACYANDNHCYQICRKCGKVSETKAPKVESAIEDVHLKRFRRDGFSLYIYGVCSTCQAKMTREKNKKKIKK